MPTYKSIFIFFAVFLVHSVAAQDYDALIQEAVAQRNLGELSGAERTLRQAYDIPADKSEVAYLLAMVIAFQERYNESISLLDQALTQAPDNISLRLGKARVRAFQGLLPEAAQQTDNVLQEQPDNIEAINLAGRIALYQQRPRQALVHFERALILDADDLEARVGRYDALLALGQRTDADAELQTLQVMAPEHIDVRTRAERRLRPPGPANELMAGVEHSRFRRAALKQWRDQFIEYRHRSSLDSSYYGRLENNHRFDARDTVVELGLLRNQQGAVPYQFSAAFSADPTFSARVRFRGGATVRLNEGSERFGSTLVSPSLQYADYRTGGVWRLSMDFEHYLAGTNIWMTPALGMVRDENGSSSLSWNLGAHWQVTGVVRMGGSFSDGAETENNRTTDTRARNAYLRWQFASTAFLQLNAAYYQRRNSYTRETVGLTLGYRY